MKRFVFFFTIILFSANGWSQTSLNKAISKLANDPVLQFGRLGISVIDVESGREIAGYQSNKTMVPASSLKVLTTGVALDVLGSDFTFKTALQYDGTIDADGTLHGNIYIKGYGDPTLGSHQFEEAMSLEIVLQKMVEAIQKKGIKKINGKIIGDGAYFDSTVNGRTWLWEDLGNYYGAGAWGLNFHENLYFLRFQQNPKLGGQPEIVETTPLIPNLLLINEVKSGERNSGDNAYIFGSPYSYTRFIRGTIPIGNELFTIKGSIPDPPFFAAFSLMNAMEAAGIQTNHQATSQAQLSLDGFLTKDRSTILTLSSPKLSKIVSITNLKSINLYCESLLRMLGQKEKGEGSAEAGLEVIYEYLKNKGINTDGLFLEDGSGLSPRNAVSAKHLATIMQHFAKEARVFDPLYESLSVGGRSGAVKYMFRGTSAENNLSAKSGGMNRVRSYTGYVRNGKGKLNAFSIIANDFTCKSSVMRNKMEKVMLAMSK